MYDLIKRPDCPICGQVPEKILCSLPFSTGIIREYLVSHYNGRAEPDRLGDAKYELICCQRCELIYQRWIPNDVLLQDIYDKWIPPTELSRLHHDYSLTDYRYWAGQVDFIIQFLRKSPHEIRILDFGMGWAEWACMARAFGCQVYGTEQSLAREEYARSIGINVIGYDEIADLQADFINTEQVFEHLVSPVVTIRQLAAGLRPGGVLKVSVPNGAKVGNKITQLSRGSITNTELMPIAPLEHINCFTHKSILELGRQAGLLPLSPSYHQLLNASNGWFDLPNLVKNLFRPIYRHVCPKSTFVYLIRPLDDDNVVSKRS